MPTRHRICVVICIALVALVRGEQRLVSAGDAAGSLLVESDPAGAALRTQLTAAAPALKIVVLEGEGAVNIIQQKTAVAPLVEVRDRNDQPVSGALVRFAISKGRATFNGARTLTATTDAAGRAAAAGLTPTGTGPLTIAASATFQGQTAAVAIAQTNVLTAAEVATAAGTGTGATGAGGGLSQTAIGGIVGAAGAGIAGAVLASKRTSLKTFAGPLNGQLVVTTSTGSAGGASVCASTRSITGTLTIHIDERSDGSVTGKASTNGTMAETSVTQSPTCSANFGTVPFNRAGNISGTATSISFDNQSSFTSTSPATVTVTSTLAFTGRLEDGVITGTLTYSEVSSGQQTGANAASIAGSGTTTMAVTLR